MTASGVTGVTNYRLSHLFFYFLSNKFNNLTECHTSHTCHTKKNTIYKTSNIKRSTSQKKSACVKIKKNRCDWYDWYDRINKIIYINNLYIKNCHTKSHICHTCHTRSHICHTERLRKPTPH